MGDWITTKREADAIIRAAYAAKGGIVASGEKAPWILESSDNVTIVMTWTGDRALMPTPAELDAIDAGALKAAADAAAALIAAMPAQFPTGVAVPIPDAAGHFMLLQPTADGAAVIAIKISDSPIDAAEWKARKDAALAAHDVKLARIDAIQTDLDQVETALDQVDATMAGPLGVLLTDLDGLNLTPSGDLGVAIAALPAGQTKTALQEVRKAMVTVRDGAVTIGNESRKIHADTKTAAKNLRQAAEKVRKEIK
jgi:hypothetical protein